LKIILYNNKHIHYSNYLEYFFSFILSKHSFASRSYNHIQPKNRCMTFSNLCIRRNNSHKASPKHCSQSIASHKRKFHKSLHNITRNTVGSIDFCFSISNNNICFSIKASFCDHYHKFHKGILTSNY